MVPGNCRSGSYGDAQGTLGQYIFSPGAVHVAKQLEIQALHRLAPPATATGHSGFPASADLVAPKMPRQRWDSRILVHKLLLGPIIALKCLTFKVMGQDMLIRFSLILIMLCCFGPYLISPLCFL